MILFGICCLSIVVQITCHAVLIRSLENKVRDLQHRVCDLESDLEKGGAE
jgi:hypothetical protein